MKRLAYTLLAILMSLPLCAQTQEEEQKDSLIWLMSAKSAKMVDVEGGRYRKVIGPARFLHNGTFLICDTALWNMETKIIDAWGNVSILQDETVLTSDNLKYLIDEDLAQFRGAVVQLTDKDHNTLRTRHLDYNTKDSVAVFSNGGSMRDKDGQIIESRNGSYDSKLKVFLFENDVNMFTDSIFVKTHRLRYESDRNLAYFGEGTNAWQEDNMLSSERGWYDREREIFLFNDYVHVMTPYLILDGELETAIKYAAQRGVDVKLILPGIPDKTLAYSLAKAHYKRLLEAGVKIYEYTPGFVHAKIFTSDDCKAVVGTINLDYRSLYHHYECAAYLYQTSCVADIEKDFQETLAKCRVVTPETIKHEKLKYKILGKLAQFIAPLM